MLKSQLPIGFVCLTKDVNRPHSFIIYKCVRIIPDKIDPVAACKTAAFIDFLPNARSHKILRTTTVIIADSETF